MSLQLKLPEVKMSSQGYYDDVDEGMQCSCRRTGPCMDSGYMKRFEGN